VNKATEAREIAALSRASKVVTQTGTQGTSAKTFRRTMEIIEAGLLGQVREAHLWCCHFPMYPPSHNRPEAKIPCQRAFNWDFWLGPAPLRPFKKGVYHPGSLKYLPWLDLSNGMLAAWIAHLFAAGSRVETRRADPRRDRHHRADQGNLHLCRQVPV